jgi:hypothetical protein
MLSLGVSLINEGSCLIDALGQRDSSGIRFALPSLARFAWIVAIYPESCQAKSLVETYSQ